MLAVRLTPEDRSSRWYPGAGIYRNVWLDITSPVHVAHWGTHVTTPSVTDEKATVAVRVEVVNQGKGGEPFTVQMTVLDPAGKSVARVVQPVVTSAASADLIVTRPQRWICRRRGCTRW